MSAIPDDLPNVPLVLDSPYVPPTKPAAAQRLSDQEIADLRALLDTSVHGSRANIVTAPAAAGAGWVVGNGGRIIAAAVLPKLYRRSRLLFGVTSAVLVYSSKDVPASLYGSTRRILKRQSTLADWFSLGSLAGGFGPRRAPVPSSALTNPGDHVDYEFVRNPLTNAFELLRPWHQALVPATGTALAAPNAPALVPAWQNRLGTVPGGILPALAVELGCFVAGTLVDTESGLRAIETIQVGERVWAYHEERGVRALFAVLRTSVLKKESVLRLQIDDERIIATHEHPFYVNGRGWIGASSLRAGDKIWTAGGDARLGTVREVYDLGERDTVYNFEVDDAHTYYISNARFLVHNSSQGPRVSRTPRGIPRTEEQAAMEARFKFPVTLQRIANARGLTVHELRLRLGPAGIRKVETALEQLELRELRARQTPQQNLPLRVVTDVDRTLIRNTPEGLELLWIWLLEYADHKVEEPGASQLLLGFLDGANSEANSAELVALSATPGKSHVFFLSNPRIHEMVAERFARYGITFREYITKPVDELMARGGSYSDWRNQTGYKLIELLQLYARSEKGQRLLLIGDHYEEHGDALSYSLFRDIVSGRIQNGELESVLRDIGDFAPWIEDVLALAELVPKGDGPVPQMIVLAPSHCWPELQMIYGTRAIFVENHFEVALVEAARRRMSIQSVAQIAERIPYDILEGRSRRPDLFQTQKPFDAVASFDEVVRAGYISTDDALWLWQRLQAVNVLPRRTPAESLARWSDPENSLAQRFLQRRLPPDQVDYPAAVNARVAVTEARAARRRAEREEAGKTWSGWLLSYIIPNH